MAVARGEDAPPLSCSFRSLPDTVVVAQKVFPVNSSLFWGYYCNFCLVVLKLCIVDVKKKKRKRQGKKKKYSKKCMCVFECFYGCVFVVIIKLKRILKNLIF